MGSLSNPPRVLITGLQGFTGQYLRDTLLAKGYRVFGTVHREVESMAADVYQLDIGNREEVSRVVSDVQPDVVAHLAAISFVAHGNVDSIYHTNLVGTRHLLEALASQKKLPRSVLIASSANIYGNASVEVINENVAAAPANDYAVSKLAMEYMARLWMERLPVVIARPFNYTGVGQAAHFLIPKIVGHFQRREPCIELGNIDVERDFSDVRMVVQAYSELLSRAPAGETFNVCSGKSISLQAVLSMMEEIAGYEIEVKINPAFVRANEVKRLQGDSSKLSRCIGAVEPIGFRDTLVWMFEKGRF